jgi:hypothetical protein
VSTRGPRLLARIIRLSTVVDRAARRFDQIRSVLITHWASPSVLDAYNDLAYERTPVYRAGTPQFRHTLFNWETEAIAGAFPDPPGRVLIGGAGGGRERLRWPRVATRWLRSSRPRISRDRWCSMRPQDQRRGADRPLRRSAVAHERRHRRTRRPEAARSLCCGAPGLDQLLTPSHIDRAHRGAAGNGRVDQRPDGAQFLHAASAACSSVGDLAPSRRGTWPALHG